MLLVIFILHLINFDLVSHAFDGVLHAYILVSDMPGFVDERLKVVNDSLIEGDRDVMIVESDGLDQVAIRDAFVRIYELLVRCCFAC